MSSGRFDLGGYWNNRSEGNKGGYGGNKAKHKPKPSKTTIYAMISLYTKIEGVKLEEMSDDQILETYLIKDSRLAEGIDNSEYLNVFNDIIEKDDKKYKMPDGEEEIPHLFIEKDKVPVNRVWSRSVACCAYNATDQYMQHWLGKKLDYNDKKWYTLNSLVTRDGLPQPYSFTVIQQLTEAYGVGINSIIVPRNTRRFDEHNVFIKALGANPFYIKDGRTTNEEAYEMMFPDVALNAMGINTPEKRRSHKKEVFSKWRFECADEPKLGSIIMRQFNLDSAGHNGGSSYVGPRAPFNLNDDKWLMCIRLDNLDNINYIEEPVLPEYKIYDGTLTYQWRKIKDGDKTLGDRIPVKKYPSYSANNSGIGQSKGDYTTGKLIALGYSKEDIKKLTWSNAYYLWNGKYKAERVKVLDNGGYIFLNSKGSEKGKEGKGQTKLLTGPTSNDSDSKSSDDDLMLAYPPLCETCQKPPGDYIFIGKELSCQHCNTIVEKQLVPMDYILEGWEPAASQSDLESYNEELEGFLDLPRHL